MKLKSIQILPKGNDGWRSNEIFFSDHITQFYGANGTGKSPLLQSVIYCLGLNTKFRKDIYENCAKAKLKIEVDGKFITLERPYSKDFYVQVVELGIDSAVKYEFYSEGQVSDYIFKLLDFENRNLVTNSKSQTSIYVSTIIPFFYSDQNTGYSSIYATEKKFIKDQFSEMIRFFFGLPEKNSFDKKKAKLKAQRELEYWDSVVLDRKSELSIVKDSMSSELRSIQELNDIVEKLNFELSLAKNSVMDTSEVDQSYSFLINDVTKRIRRIDRELISINQKINSVDSIVAEIEDEISTLNLNEEARREFLDFNEICSNANNSCGLFSRFNETYSKSLLYLKDQIKDLRRNKYLDDEKKLALSNEKHVLKKELYSLIEKRQSSIKSEESRSSILLFNELEKKLFEAKSELSDVLKVEEYEKRYIEALNGQESAQSKLNSFGKDNEKLTDIVKIRLLLAKRLVKWLSVLKTRNVSFDIKYVNDFEPVFDGEPIQNLSGSTKIRVLLAYHAALLESILFQGGYSLPFLIFDTPKQHEIDSEDLDTFFKELKSLCSKFDVQVIFSTSEYHYVGDFIDLEYLPQYEGVSQKMYLYNPQFNR